MRIGKHHLPIAVAFILGPFFVLSSFNVFVDTEVTGISYDYFLALKSFDRLYAFFLFLLFIFSVFLFFIHYELKPILSRRLNLHQKQGIFSCLTRYVQMEFTKGEVLTVKDSGKLSKKRVFGVLGIITIHLIIVLQRYRDSFGILGFDSPYYIYSAELLYYFGFLQIFSTGKHIPTLMSYAIYSVFGSSFDLVGLTLLVVLTVVYALVVFFSVLLKTKNYFLSICVGLSAPLNYIFTRTSYDLYAQLLANCLLVAFLVAVSSFADTPRPKQGVSLVVVIVLIYLTHFWTWLIAVSYLLLALVVLSLNEYILRRKVGRVFRAILILLLFVLGFSLLLAIANQGKIDWILGLFGTELNLFVVPPYWNSYVLSEIPIVWIISIVGVLALLKLNESLGFVTLLWTLFLTSLVFILGYDQSYRLFILYPLPLLLGIGLYGIHDGIVRLQRIRLGRFSLDLPQKRTAYAFITVLVLTSFMVGETTARAYFPEFDFRPSEESINQLHEIREAFGFENESIILMLTTEGTGVSYYWAMMIVGSNLYEGTLLGILSGQPDRRGRLYDLENKTLVLGDMIYAMSEFEYALCVESRTGIFVFEPSIPHEDVDNLIEDISFFYTDFTISSDGWHLTTRTLFSRLSYVNESSGLVLVIVLSDNNTSGWFTIEREFDSGLNSSMFHEMVFAAECYTEKTSILLEAYYDDGRVASTQTGGQQGNVWITQRVLSDGLVVKIRFALVLTQPLDEEETLMLRYLALI